MNLLISQNLAALRRMHGYTLEQTAEKNQRNSRRFKQVDL